MSTNKRKSMSRHTNDLRDNPVAEHCGQCGPLGEQAFDLRVLVLFVLEFGMFLNECSLIFESVGDLLLQFGFDVLPGRE